MPNPYLPMTDANADDWVDRPGCLRPDRRRRNSPCGVCGATEMELRIVKRWVAVAVTTDGEVR